MSDDEAQQTCLNCGAILGGQYCGDCGQRATTRLISIWQLVREAFGDLFELDSRLWRTLLPLLFQPGKLTQDYLQGRRARYMPPFRMYLVFSLIFFLVAFFDPHSDFEILYEADESPTGEDQATDSRGAEARKKTSAEVQEALDELIAEGILDESLVGRGKLIDPGAPLPEDPVQPAIKDQQRVGIGTRDIDDADTLAPGTTLPPDDDSTVDSGLVMSLGTLNLNCSEHNFSTEGSPLWIQKRLTPERLRRVCERYEVLGKDGFIASLIEKIPAALILLLPLMALVLKILYPLSRRYYVEHLLFFVHFHAFFFLLLTLQILWHRLLGVLWMPEVFAVLPITATSFYYPTYLYLAMRRVYGQRRFLTFLKFCLLSITYLLGFSTMMIGVLILAVFSV